MNPFSYLWRKLFPVSVTAITSDLQRIVNRLEAAMDHHYRQSDIKTTKANALLAQSADHMAEVHTAAAVRTNLNALINPGTTT